MAVLLLFFELYFAIQPPNIFQYIVIYCMIYPIFKGMLEHFGIIANLPSITKKDQYQFHSFTFGAQIDQSHV